MGSSGGKSKTTMKFSPAKRSKEGEALLFSLMGLMGFPGGDYTIPSAWMASPAVAQYYNMLGSGWLQDYWKQQGLPVAPMAGSRTITAGGTSGTAASDAATPDINELYEWWYKLWGDNPSELSGVPSNFEMQRLYQLYGADATKDIYGNVLPGPSVTGGAGTSAGTTMTLGEGMPSLFNPADALAQYLISTMKTAMDYQDLQDYYRALATKGQPLFESSLQNALSAMQLQPINVNFAGTTIPIAPVRTRESALRLYQAALEPLLREAGAWGTTAGARHSLYQDMMARIFEPYFDLARLLEQARYSSQGSRTTTQTTSGPGFFGNLLGTASQLGTAWALGKILG